MDGVAERGVIWPTFDRRRETRKPPAWRHSDEGQRPQLPPTTVGEGLTEPRQADWIRSVIEQAKKLRSLPAGWDGYGAGPIRTDVLQYMLELLDRALTASTPAPHLTPMSHEGVMLEWHRPDFSLEIEIENPGKAYVVFEDKNTGKERSIWVEADIRELSKLIYSLKF